MQNANEVRAAPATCLRTCAHLFAAQVGEAATYSHWTLKDLLKPPTSQDIKKEINDTVTDATSGL